MPAGQGLRLGRASSPVTQRTAKTPAWARWSQPMLRHEKRRDAPNRLDAETRSCEHLGMPIRINISTKAGPLEISCEPGELAEVLRALGGTKSPVHPSEPETLAGPAANKPATSAPRPKTGAAAGAAPAVGTKDLDQTQRRLPVVLGVLRGHADGVTSEDLAHSVGMDSRGLSAIIRLVRDLTRRKGMSMEDILVPGRPRGKRGWYPGPNISALLEDP